MSIKNGQVDKINGAIVRYQTTPKGTDSLWHFNEQEELVPELGVMAKESLAAQLCRQCRRMP